jgi:predicted phosphohydrolase
MNCNVILEKPPATVLFQRIHMLRWLPDYQHLNAPMLQDIFDPILYLMNQHYFFIVKSRGGSRGWAMPTAHPEILENSPF